VRLRTDGSPDHARALAAEALTTEGWFEAIPVVGDLDPEALRSFAEVLCGTPAGQAAR